MCRFASLSILTQAGAPTIFEGVEVLAVRQAFHRLQDISGGDTSFRQEAGVPDLGHAPLHYRSAVLRLVACPAGRKDVSSRVPAAAAERNYVLLLQKGPTTFITARIYTAVGAAVVVVGHAPLPVRIDVPEGFSTSLARAISRGVDAQVPRVF